MTPLLHRIEQALATCTDPLQQAELLAERACYFARTGDFAGAHAIVSSLRHTYGDGRSVRISVWIMLIEGLILYFDQTDLAARGRLLRAHAISDTFGLQDLRRLTAVWLAHIEFNRSDFAAMLLLLHKVAQFPGGWVDASAIRFSLLLADSYMYCGQTSLATRWYHRARRFAVNHGDEASIAALIYNKSALALSHFKIMSSLKASNLSSLRFISLEIESAYSFHVGTAHASLVQLIETCRARALLLERRFVEARTLFESLLSQQDLALGIKSDRIIVELEYAQCLLELKLEFEARQRFLAIDAKQYVQMSIDDQLMFLLSYVDTGNALNLHGEVVPFTFLVKDIRERYQLDIDTLKFGLDDLCRGLSIS